MISRRIWSAPAAGKIIYRATHTARLNLDADVALTRRFLGRSPARSDMNSWLMCLEN